MTGADGSRGRSSPPATVLGGVAVDVADADGVTPLAHAEERGHEEIVRILRAAGARRSP